MLSSIVGPLRQVKRGLISGAESLRRKTTARYYGNSLPVLMNERYRIYNERCRKTYPGETELDGKTLDIACKVRDDGFALIENAIPNALAATLSQRITAEIERNPTHDHRGQTRHLQYKVNHPIAVLGREVLDLFRGPADRILRAHFGSYYRLHQVKCYRSLPAEDPKGAWLWHTDNYPAEVKKIMLYLTDCSPEQGVTSFISPSQTEQLRRAGYDGTGSYERSGNLEEFAHKGGFEVDIKWGTIPAGSAIFFEVNTLHRANIPKVGHRDVITFTVMPSKVPWDVALDSSGIEAIERERLLYPPHPGRLTP